MIGFLFLKIRVFTNDQYLGWIDSKISLSSKKLQTIELHYSSINEAVLDKFGLIESTKNKWVSKLQEVDNFNSEIETFVRKNQELDIQIISLKNPLYPPILSQLSDLPVVLYSQGNLELLNLKNGLTVVGSRNFSKYSELVLQRILTTVCKQGIPIISGLALGIDGLAHKIAVENNCPTLAVIGSGLDDFNFYPSNHLGLKKQIIATGGLVMSQYCIGTKPNPYNFPTRNKILACLGDLVWVVQAGLKSGSLITANLATDLGKTLATTPASILDGNFGGNIKLLKDGVQIITSSEDIFDLLGLQHLGKIDLQREIKFESEIQKTIYECFRFEAKSVEQLALDSKLDLSEISSNLSLLEMSGLVTNLGGNVWTRV